MALTIKDLAQFGNLEFLAKKAVEGFITGLHKSPYNGFSVEFSEHSQYNTGDSTRHIDWKVFGRTDKLYLKNYEDETNLRCQIIIDASSSMYYPASTKAKINFSCLAAASLCYLNQKQRDAVGFMSFNTTIDVSTPLKSSKIHLYKIFNQLDELRNRASNLEKTSLSDVLHQVAYKLPKRGLVILFSDLLEDEEKWDHLFPALQHLKHQKHEIIIFHTQHHSSELDFEFEDKPHLFIDPESGQEVKVLPNQVKEQYIRDQRERCKLLKTKAQQYKIDFIEADVEQSVNNVLQQYLIKRNKIR